MVKIYRDEDMINIIHPDWSAYTNYCQDLFEIISKVNWTGENGRHVYSNQSRKSLHQIVMIYWYGDAEFNEAKRKGFVIDHHNNNGFDCTIENLTFIPSSINKAKGLTYDENKVLKQRLMAVNFYKDFHSKKYQITVVFNIPTKYYSPNGRIINLAVLKLLYEDNFEQVLIDCQNILLNKPGEIFRLNKLSFIDMRYEEAKQIFLSEDEKNNPIIERDGQVHIIQGSDTLVISTPPDKNWN